MYYSGNDFTHLFLEAEPNFQELFELIAIYMQPQQNELENLKKQIQSCLKKFFPYEVLISNISSRGMTLFQEILQLAAMNGPDALHKLEDIFAIFKYTLPTIKWSKFLISGLKESFSYIRQQFWHSFFISRIHELVYEQNLSSDKKRKLMIFIDAINFTNLDKAINENIPLRAGAAIDLVYQPIINLDEIRDALEEAAKEPRGFVNVFVRTIVIKDFKARLDAVLPEFSRQFFKEKLLAVRYNGVNVLDMANQLQQNDLVQFLIKNCDQNPKPLPILESKAEQPKKLNPEASEFIMPESELSPTEAFLSFFYIYLEQMRIDLLAFKRKLDLIVGEKTYIAGLIEELTTLVFEVIKENPRTNMSLDPANLWRQMDFSPATPQSVYKLKKVKDSLTAIPEPQFFPISMWNFFIFSHIKSLDIMQQIPHTKELSPNETTKTFLSKLSQALSSSFLATRIQTAEEEQEHICILQLESYISIALMQENLGHCLETLEYSLNIASYLPIQPGKRVDATTCIFTEIYSEQTLDSLKEVIERFFQTINLNLERAKISSTSFSFRFRINDKLFDWCFSTRPFKELANGFEFPIKSLAYNLKKRAIYNPENTTDVGKLILPCIYKDGIKTEIVGLEWQALKADADKVAYVIETMVMVNYSLKIKQKNHTLIAFLMSALRHIQDNPEENALIKLFSKKTFSVAQFNHFVREYELAFIFGLNQAENGFFKYIDYYFSKKQTARSIENYEYIALALHHVYKIEIHRGTQDLPAKITNLAAKFLQPQFVMKIMPLILEIEADLSGKHVKHRLDIAFNLKHFYQQRVNGPNPYRFMTEPKPKPEPKPISMPTTVAKAPESKFSFDKFAAMFASVNPVPQLKKTHKSVAEENTNGASI